MRARWLIGADGAGSGVRRLAGLPFEGMTWPERFIATNLWFDFEKSGYGLATLAIDARFGAVIVKITRDGLWRCTYMEDGALPEGGFRNRLPEAYRGILPHDGPYRVERATPYRMHQRSAPRYRHGRVLLAGDAAHVTNPTGGLGLTCGLFDAYALYPALAAVILEGAPDEVLDRYGEARRAVFLERASPQAVINKRFVFHANGGGAELDEALDYMRLVASDPDVRLDRFMFTKSLESAPLLGAPMTVA
jgi:3-(3-hydroxy-phenyl)propionate hydroxylase/6-hydroxy-3-succinoylpyridine 3-monooxygenase